MSAMQKPKKRSYLRRLYGILHYTIKRKWQWHCSGISFAARQEKHLLPELIFKHQTPLRRPLKGVDISMQENKITNLKIALKNLDGLVLEPGQRFSYWRQIGNPTRKKGYVKGMLLHNGTVRSGIGGGLCQLSNLLYWMTLHTPLTVLERWRHSYDVFPDVQRKQPFGSGATCAYPNIDLQIGNPTKECFQLHLTLTETHLVGEWRSEKALNEEYEVFEKDHKIDHEWWGGYVRRNSIYRKVFDKASHEEKGEEFITSNEALMMYNPLLEGSSS
ncbi:VanW family protein [Candidatus Peregrinibacteria bacterium]|nr:MAG: VanW family protein [Candidatus Peregrinibacteria bacterium]